MNFEKLIDMLHADLGGCVQSKEFLSEYIINGVLLYIENKEQDLILGMRFNSFVQIDEREKSLIIEFIFKLVEKLYNVCGKTLSIDSNKLKEYDVIEYSLCYLFYKGIYGDCISKYILFSDVDHHVLENDFNSCDNEKINKCIEYLKKIKSFGVRSRFIEIARDLYNLKRRFPDWPVYESPYLVDRVFAYVHPRELPLGVYTISECCLNAEECNKDVKELLVSSTEFFKNLYKFLNNNDPSHQEINMFNEILCKFFSRLESIYNIRWYKFQLSGITRAIKKLNSVITQVENSEYLVIQAPTGSGKTEIMVITNIIAALSRKLALHSGQKSSNRSTPISIIIYPRRALANDQISRLIGYLVYMNEILSGYGISPIALSINYTEVRPLEEYRKALEEYRKAAEKLLKEKISGCKPLKMRYGVTAYLCKDGNEYFVELRFLTCPRDGNTPTILHPRLRVDEKSLDIDSTPICGKVPLKFLRITKEAVKKELADIYVTTFETLRINLLSKYYNDIFFQKVGDANLSPLILVLDEIHTYTDIAGVRYSYLIKRINNKIKYLCRQSGGSRCPGLLHIGMSATIPNAHEFLSSLFGIGISEDSLKRYIVTVGEDEVIPLGSEYFYIVVPSLRSGVDAVSVSIQTIMNVFFNLPSIYEDGEWRKKGIVFVDEMNVLRRMIRDLYSGSDAALRREDQFGRYGLQDLRNPRHNLFDSTKKAYGDPAPRGLLDIPRLRSWEDGEVWWGYMLDVLKNRDGEYPTTKFYGVVEYSSSRRDTSNEGERGGVVGLIVATSALEVGVDYSDVIMVYQHGAPPNIPALIQRAGRGGRRAFRHPLMRTAIGIQLSPELPHQAWLFEIFTKSRSLREALKYDRLYIPVVSWEIAKQMAVELALEYYFSIGQQSENGEDLSKNGEDFECKKLLDIIKSSEYKKYIKGVFGDENFIERITSDVDMQIRELCDRQ